MTPTHHPENSLEMMMMMKSEEIAEKTQLPEKTQQAAVFFVGVSQSWVHACKQAELECDS